MASPAFVALPSVSPFRVSNRVGCEICSFLFPFVDAWLAGLWDFRVAKTEDVRKCRPPADLGC